MSRHADLEEPIQRPTLFVGREAELERLAGASARVPVVLICGVAGVGKSALASAFAATWPGPVVTSHLAGETLAELVDDVGRALGAAGAADIGSVAERLRGFAARLDAAAGLWLIDDLHRLGPDDRRLAFRVLGRSLRRGRVVVTSRERVGVDAGGPDHAELRLGGLADPDARRLWQLLDGLYGPAAGFEVAMARSDGNPFLLRRGHAGDLSREDPLGDSVGGLSPAERRAAAALALSGIRLPLDLIARLVGSDEVREVVRRLVDRMMVEAHPEGLSMHDLVRDAMLRSLPADERAALHRDLALLLPDSSLDPARRARAVCRHLRALDRHEEAARYLIERGSELDKFGAAGELLRGLAAIPEDRRSPEASAALARVSARAFDLSRAYAEHERLLGGGVGPQVELALVHALLALLTGRPAVADASLDRIARAGELPPAIQIRALTTRAMVRAYAGEPGEAAEVLLGAIARAPGPAAEAPLWLYLAFIQTTEERDADAHEAIGRALVLRGENAMSYRSSVLASTVLAAVAGALGHFAEAEAALDEARQLMAGDEDVLLTTYVRYTRASLLAERGDWVEALEALRSLVELFRKGGHLVGELSGAALQGRILLLMGRRAEALELLGECRAAAVQRGLRGIERAVERALACDPARLLGRADELGPGVGAAGRPGTRVWHRLASAIQLAAEGEPRRASALVAAEASLPVRPGHELGRALAAVVDAVIAMVAGESAAVEAHLAAARAVASAAGLDEDIVSALLAALGPLRVVSAGGSRIAAAVDLTVGPDDRVVDARSHELRSGTQTVSLLRRPMLRRLLYGLARRRGVVVSKDELAAALWARAYNPISDHGPLKSNIANLRKLIEPAGMSIDFDDDGYRLVGAERLIYIEPISWPAG